MNYFLGIDVSSSRTPALTVDENGRCVGFGRSGGGNHQGVGYERLAEVLQLSFSDACEMSGIETSQIAGAGFGVAGYDFPSDRERHLQAIASLGLTCPLEVVNDGRNRLFAAATCGIGVNITAGSGVNCRGRSPSGQEGRVVGNGIEFGEFGGASEIVFRGMQYVNYAWIRCIPPTMLTKIYLDAAGAKDETDLMEGLSNHYYHLFPDLAIQIAAATQQGDHGEELGWLAVAVARQIGMGNDEGEIIQSGSVFEAGEIITGPMRELVLSHCPRAKLIRLDGPRVVGPVILGMEHAGFDGYAVRDRIVRTAKERVQ